MLRVAYVGNFEPTFSTETHFAAALQELGVEVLELSERTSTCADILRACQGVDLLLYTRTEGLTPSPRAEWLRMLANLPIPSASYHLDLYAGLRRERGLRDDPFWRTKYVFSADGGSDDFFKEHGVDHHWLRAGVHGPECYITTPSPAYQTDVLFIGSGGHRFGYHAEWPWRDEMLRFLASTYGPRFSKHGHPPLGPVGRPHVRGHELNVALASAKVVVGDSIVLGPGQARGPIGRHERYWSDRVYETMGRGGFLIMPRISGLELEFKDGEHFATFELGNLESLRRTIDYWLARDVRRERVRRAGHEKVRADCTYVNRAREMLTTIAGLEPAVAAAWSST